MNLPKPVLRRAVAAAALCAGFFLIATGRAQPAQPAGIGRFLFIFDTSTDMKKRLPAVQAEVRTLLSTSLGGQLQSGDSIGVWTFDQNLRTGQFPLQFWKPEDAVAVASNLNKFLGKQRYANRTRFDALQPQLNDLIHNSARLTVLIFCDGEDAIKWTPYDAGLNRNFQQRLAGQKKAAQPFVLVLRTQLAEYAGCSLNFPPGMVNVPNFPPLPAPPAAAKTPPPAPPPQLAPITTPPPTGPPLIIIGTKVQTNWPTTTASFPLTNTAPAAPARAVSAAPTNPVVPPLPELSAPARPTNSIVVAPINPVTPLPVTNPAPVIQTNVAVQAPTNPAPATPVAPAKIVSIPPSNPVATTIAVAPPPEASGANHKGAIAIGVALLAGAGALGALAVFRFRRPSRGSLITRSMRKD